MSITIIREKTQAMAGKKLNELVARCNKVGKQYEELLSETSLNVVFHAAVYGQCQPMTTFYNALTSNNQQAFKQFLRRLNIYIGLEKSTDDKVAGLTKDELNAAAEKGKVFDYRDKVFTVVSMKTDPRASVKRTAAASYMDVWAEAVDDERYTPFWKRNNFAEVRVLGDAQALEALKRVLAQANKKSEEGKTVNTISAKMKTLIEETITTAEQIAENETSASDTNEVLANMAQVARENKATPKEAGGSTH